MTALVFCSDVENELQVRFPQNKRSPALYKMCCAGVWETSPQCAETLRDRLKSAKREKYY